MNIDQYLHRIGYSGSRQPSLDTLIKLHKAHLHAVPFENLDIHLGRPIILDQEMIFKKIVHERRGGFCYELNGAFCGLLRLLGFEVSMLSAGVARGDGTFGPDFDHMSLLVHCEGRRLADVGFGDSFSVPLDLDERGEQTQGADSYRLVETGNRFILERRDAQAWKPQYWFTLDPHELDEYRQMCLYHQTSPESTFTQRRTCTRATADGRMTVTGLRLIETAGGEKQERLLADDNEWRLALRQHFGIELQSRLETT